MQSYLSVLKEAALDTIKVVPFLFIIYYLIELFEYKCANKLQNSKLLKGKVSPIIGSLVGSIPQCGFSVISTDLFKQGAISVGALIAVYIATSDEAIPLMLSNVQNVKWMAILIVVKIIYAIIVGYISLFLYKLIFKKENQPQNLPQTESKIVHDGCCHHNVEAKSFDWLHPLLHCLKISAFILIVNILFGFITDIWVDEDNLINFLNKSLYLQPLLAVVIGFIPNCASSVVLTEMFLLNGLSFGALLSGLCVNAGLGMILLIKENKNWKVNLFVILSTTIFSLILGYLTIFIM